jgi:hypothetical protein
MDQDPRDRRILTIALRSRRFAFSVFEGPDKLLDWGMVFYPLNNGAQRTAASKRIASLFTQFTPSEVVVGKARLLNTREDSGVRLILRSLRHEASSRLIPLCFMRRPELNGVFCQFHVRSKHEIASMLAQVFPELLWKLPPKRRIPVVLSSVLGFIMILSSVWWWVSIS